MGVPVDYFERFTPKEGDALVLILSYGGIDGAHHKDWVLDQIVRIITGDDYDEFVEMAKDGEDGPNTYSWDVGVPP
jgi:hypothetical protein